MPKGRPKFDHGAALRVPPLTDVQGWGRLWQWLGSAADWAEDRHGLQVETPEGMALAQPGDWIVLSVSGHYHVARAAQRLWDA